MGDRPVFERLHAEAEMMGWRVGVSIAESADPKARRSRLGSVQLVDRHRKVLTSVSLLHNDDLDSASRTLLEFIAGVRRP